MRNEVVPGNVNFDLATGVTTWKNGPLYEFSLQIQLVVWSNLTIFNNLLLDQRVKYAF